MTSQPGPTRPYHEYIGGSKIAALMGVSPWADSLDVYNQIVNKERIEPNYKMKWGIWSERAILERVVEDTGLTFEYPGTLTVPGMDHIAATPDAVEYTATVQLKTMGPTQYQSTEWGPDGSSYIPEHVYYQGNFEAGVFRDVYDREPTGFRIIAWCMEWRTHNCEFDEDLYELCKQTADDFWKSHVIPKIPPVRVKPELPEWFEDDAYSPLVQRYLELRDEEKAIHEEKRDVAADLRRAADKVNLKTEAGTVRVLESKGRVNFNALVKDLKQAGVLSRSMLETYRGEPGHRIEVREAK